MVLDVSTKTYTTAEVIRDGYKPKTVFSRTGLKGQTFETPADAYAVGCNWLQALGVHLEEGKWPSAFYLIIIRIKDINGRVHEREGFLIVKEKKVNSAKTDFVLIHATSTMLAYNDWGGANHYRGIADGYQNDEPTPLLSTQRPIARGMLRIPKNAPREANGTMTVGHGATPRYPSLEYSWYFHYSWHYADEGWATYEPPFTICAESQGYVIHHLTQSDLHQNPDYLTGYACAVSMGHDEYWSWEQRDTLDDFVDSGGRFACFGGHFIWQVRFDETMHTEYCYRAPQADPMAKKDPARVTLCAK